MPIRLARDEAAPQIRVDERRSKHDGKRLPHRLCPSGRLVWRERKRGDCDRVHQIP